MRTQMEFPMTGMEAAKHSMFVIGRIVKGEQQLVFLRPRSRPPIPGPWELRASVAKHIEQPWEDE